MGGKGDGTGDKKKEDTKGEKTKGSLLEEDDKTTTAKPTGDKKDAKGKGDGTGDKKTEDKKEAEKKKGSILEEDDKTTTAKPTGHKKVPRDKVVSQSGGSCKADDDCESTCDTFRDETCCCVDGKCFNYRYDELHFCDPDKCGGIENPC